MEAKMKTATAQDIKMVAIDLDGTLLREDKTPHPRVAPALKEALEAGLTVVLASGRMIGGMLPYARELQVSGPIVSCNGGYVVDEAHQEIHHFCLKDTIRDEVLAFVDERDLHLNVYLRDEIYFSRESEWGDIYLSRVKDVTPSVLASKELKRIQPTKMLIMDTAENSRQHREELERRISPETVAIVASEPEYLEFLPPHVNKGEGVRTVAERLGFTMENVAAIGDFLNDLEMVKKAGFGAAVENAHPQVRESASQTYPSNEEGGVADFLADVVRN
jgi:hypothetical protein